MSKIESSPKLGTLSADCVRNFTVHFRRPYEIGRPSDRYHGEFGFDWVRDEYIYPLLNIEGKKDTVLIVPNYSSLYQVMYSNTDSTYHLKDNFSYFPSWLYFFASNYKGIYGSEEINKDGVCLDIEIHQQFTDKNDPGLIDEKEPLTDNGTILKFQASSKFITLSTFNNNQNAQTVFENENSIEYKPLCEPLSSFINTKREFKKLDAREDITTVNGETVKKIVETNRYSYKKNNAITIRCSGAVLKKNEYIKVIASRNGCPDKEVGVIYIGQNSAISVISMVEVDVKVKGEILEKPKNYEWELKNRYFNQSLMVFKVVKRELFDLDLLSKTDPEVRSFVKKWWEDEIKSKYGIKYLENITGENEIKENNLKRKKKFNLTEAIYTEFIRELKELYWRKMWVEFRSPYSDLERRTFIFFTPIRMRAVPPENRNDNWGGISGSASFKAYPSLNYFKGELSSQDEFDNAIVFFKDGVEQGFLETYAHELGHALGLTHIFEYGELFESYQGYTDNLMDYDYTTSNAISKFKNRVNILSKYQIDNIRLNQRITGILWIWVGKEANY
ncbi:M43 family zinc metalloprotease [Acinetobacter bereziniae]|uniref:Uncharacterized protein n=2 Tax=Acinetobacter bereziniae TaxID=106648 RepID=N8XEX0_ACIBZ|nr:M43 family zinc metalloprotease [Acinetobacter bereziniae]ENV23017.1 hypothetical protein F963_00991 [Acinetobacter bereziniae NIPH 3]